MKAILVFIFLLALPFMTQAESLCDQAVKEVSSKVSQFDGTKMSKRSLIAAFHNSKTSIEQLCSYGKLNEVKRDVAQLLKKKNKRVVLGHNAYRPRKTVEIDTIYSPYDRRPASR